MIGLQLLKTYEQRKLGATRNSSGPQQVVTSGYGVGVSARIRNRASYLRLGINGLQAQLACHCVLYWLKQAPLSSVLLYSK